MKKYRVIVKNKEAIIPAYSARVAISKMLRSIIGTRTADRYITEDGYLIIKVIRDTRRNEH